MNKKILIAVVVSVSLAMFFGCTQRDNKTDSDNFNWIVKPIFDDLYSFSEGLAIASVNGKWGYIEIGRAHV